MWLGRFCPHEPYEEPMSKAALVEHVAEQAGLSKKAAGEAVDAVFDGIAKALKKEGSLSIIGFGGFVVRKRAARKGRNPQTGEEIKIKASKSVGFRASKALNGSL